MKSDSFRIATHQSRIHDVSLFSCDSYILEPRRHTYVLIGDLSKRFQVAPPLSSGSVLDHGSQPRVFESRRGHICRVFHL